MRASSRKPVDAMRRAAEIDDFPTAWLDVAQLELELGDDAAARDAIDRAMRIGFQNPQVAYGAMTIYEALGDRDAAVSAAADALVAAPGLASDPDWASNDALGDIRASALPVAYDRARPEAGYKIALEAGDPDTAASIVDRIPESEREMPALAVAAWSGDRAAFDAIHARAVANPLDAIAVPLCNRLAGRSRDPDWPGSTPWRCDKTWLGNEPVIRVAEPPSERVTLPGPDAPWHHQYVYRRLTPDDELVPLLPHLEQRYQ